MLKGFSDIEDDALACINNYRSFKRGEADAVLAPSNGDPTSAHGLRMVGENCKSIARRARTLLGRQDAPQLSPDSRDNLTAIAEELELAVAEIEAEADPDVVYASQPREVKNSVTQRLQVHRGKVDMIRARIRGERRGEPGPPANPGNGGGNPNK